MNKLSSKPLFKHPHLVIAPCKFGYGVFATEFIPADTIIEECYYLRIRKEDCLGIINDYVFGIESENDDSEDLEYNSLIFGLGSIFNHADEHNTEYWHDTERDLIVFHTIKNVSVGEQLYINYGKAWWKTRNRMPDKDR